MIIRWVRVRGAHPNSFRADDNRRSWRLITPRDRNGNEKREFGRAHADAFNTFTMAESEQNVQAALCQLQSAMCATVRTRFLLRHACLKTS